MQAGKANVVAGPAAGVHAPAQFKLPPAPYDSNHLK
jgi:hypothetical protein